MAIVTPRPTRILTVFVLVAGLVLTGCSASSDDDGDNDGSTNAPTSTESISGEYVTASAEGPAQNVRVPELPEEAKEQTIEGAEATLEYWWEAFEYLYLTNDPEPLATVSANECLFCSHFTDVVASTYSEDGWFTVEGPFTINGSEGQINEEDDAVRVEYSLSQPTSQKYRANGEIDAEGSIDETQVSMETVLYYSSEVGHWQVRQSAWADEGESPDE